MELKPCPFCGGTKLKIDSKRTFKYGREKQWTDREIRRFNFCPLCGEKIDWKALKKSIRERD